MDIRRSPRKPKPVTIWEEKGAPSAAKNPKITKKNARIKQKTALKPIAVEPLPTAIELNEKQLPELPTYTPPFELRHESSDTLATGLSELHLRLLLLKISTKQQIAMLKMLKRLMKNLLRTLAYET